MTGPYDPCGKIYTILSEEWTRFLWFFEPVFIPPVFREHLVLVLGWTTGRRGYVSIVMITPTVPAGANPDHYMRIRAPRRGAVVSEGTVMLRKNKAFSVLVEDAHVRLDWVWEVPFTILLDVPRVGMQLMLRHASMERIMGFYAAWGWDQAWGQTYRPRPECRQWAAGSCHEGSTVGSPESIRQGGEFDYPHATPQSCQSVGVFASSGRVEQAGDAEGEILAGSDSSGSWNSPHEPNNGGGRHSEGVSPHCARQEMVYAGDAHCAMLAELLRGAR